MVLEIVGPIELSRSANRLAGTDGAGYGYRMITRPITLLDEHERLIQQALKSGRYVSESEVVAAALSEFQVHEEIRRVRFAELKTKIQVGIDELDRGETAEFNLEEFLAARNAERVNG
jgi:putative addiction module CopG family antidote